MSESIVTKELAVRAVVYGVEVKNTLLKKVDIAGKVYESTQLEEDVSGNIKIPSMTSAGYVKNDASGVLSGGNPIYISESNTNLPAVSGSCLLWFDPVNGWLKFRKKLEDADANVYVISLSDPIPE